MSSSENKIYRLLATRGHHTNNDSKFNLENIVAFDQCSKY